MFKRATYQYGIVDSNKILYCRGGHKDASDGGGAQSSVNESLRLGINRRLNPANTYLDQTPPSYWRRLIKAIKEPLEGRTLMQWKTEKELTEVLDRVFLVALLITGNMDGAEEAILDGIAALDGTISSDGF